MPDDAREISFPDDMDAWGVLDVTRGGSKINTDAKTDKHCLDALPNYSDTQSVNQTTAAIQCRLNYAGTLQNSGTVYFPPGIYYVNQELSLTLGYFPQNQDGSLGTYKFYGDSNIRADSNGSVHVMGRNPMDTTIMWAGSCAKDLQVPDQNQNGQKLVKYSSMLWVDGISPLDVERLTFDGHNCAGVGIDMTSEANGISPAHLHELVIQNLKQVGIVGGRPPLAVDELKLGDQNGMVSEVSINQVSFEHIDYAGIAVLTPNALDYWIRDSYFEDCAIGITNSVGGAGYADNNPDVKIPGLPFLAPLPWGGAYSGGFSVSNSVFRNSRASDIVAGSGRIGVRNNYSLGSAGTFFQSYPTPYQGAVYPYLQGNTVVAGPAVPVALPDWKDFAVMIGNKFITGASQPAFWVWTDQKGLNANGGPESVGASEVVEKIADLTGCGKSGDLRASERSFGS